MTEGDELPQEEVLAFTNRAIMDHLGHRALTSQLADDLGWLEEHSRRRGLSEAVLQASSPEKALQASELRLAAALVRNCVGPYLNGQPPTPLHIAVVGGAGAGKSTVANLLSGAPAAESNPQAGFTRHPIVYTSSTGALNWAGHLGFLGPLQRAPQESPASLDADVYQVRRVPADPTSFDLLKDFVVWDCPDMTTWAAAGLDNPDGSNQSPGYITRLLEVAGLADVLVYVASDERYNDEVPTQFLRLLLHTSKPVIVVLTKMREADASSLVQHFRQEVMRTMPSGIADVIAIPHLTPDQLSDPARKANKYRIPLLNQVAVIGQPPARARKNSVYGALRFLAAAQERLLAVARNDVEALQSWRVLVQHGQVEFDQRYYREYLTSEKYRGFDEALLRLLQLLELPGLGKVLSGALWVIRTPYRLLKGLLGKAMRRPDTPTMPEQPILDDALTGWVDGLRKEAARQANVHPLWLHIAQGFSSGGLAQLARERFEQGFRGFQMALAEETDRTAREVYERLEKNPAALNTLRTGKFALDVASIAGAVVVGGGPVADIILVPIFASLTHQLVELMGKQYVDGLRELTRQKQRALMGQYISSPLAEWLAQWPATGGSAFERLQLALRRIPQALQAIQKAVESTPTR
jgi:GTP-binding protein EngB required for normal cell division